MFILWIKGCQFFSDGTNHNSYGLVITAVTKVRMHIVYILDYMIFSCTDGYVIYFRSCFSYTAVKYQSSLWQYFPPISDTYFTSIYLCTINLFLPLMSYFRTFRKPGEINKLSYFNKSSKLYKPES